MPVTSVQTALLFTTLTLGLTACQTTTTPRSEAAATAQAVSQDAIRAAATASELLALGARPLSAAEIQSELVGQTLTEGSWSWTIRSDGTASSAANDGSWASTSTWDISGNQYCRQGDSIARKCSDIYELGGIYRFSETASKLADWSVTVQ